MPEPGPQGAKKEPVTPTGLERLPDPAAPGLGSLAGFLGEGPVSGRVWAARILAVTADLFQIVFFPAFSPGFASPFDDVLDVVVSVAMIALLGWHWAFLPTAIAKIVPALDLVPTWTLAVFLVTRGQSPGAPPPVGGAPRPGAP